MTEENPPSWPLIRVVLALGALGVASTLILVVTSVANLMMPVETQSRSRTQSATASAAEPLPSWVWPVALGATALLVAIGCWAYWLVVKERLMESARERRAVESAADRLREKMELPSLVDFNRVLLDQYHGIATEQASKAYRSSRFAMGVGLGILVVAFVAGWRLNAQGDRLFVGSVAAVGTAFTAYLSRTYMQTYERALQQLNQYFNQPVLNGYFLTAERIADRLAAEHQLQYVIYRNGARMPVAAWAESATLAKSAVAYNAGTLNRAREAGVRFMQVFDGPGCGWTSRRDPDKATGTLRTVEDAAKWPISHPRCTRGFGPRPDHMP
ncbi:hypothetical protein ABZY09_39750 [Streptomyces sp. NPDC002928]|uniref:hypothetical protein n=1 Tax=Streptomyces sp. NPDC002928 TaxID=3154440 RepID=UPI00339ED5EB